MRHEKVCTRLYYGDLGKISAWYKQTPGDETHGQYFVMCQIYSPPYEWMFSMTWLCRHYQLQLEAFLLQNHCAIRSPRVYRDSQRNWVDFRGFKTPENTKEASCWDGEKAQKCQIGPLQRAANWHCLGHLRELRALNNP